MIRFQRVGRKNDPAFRIVLAEKRSKPKSGEIKTLGSFYPKTKEARLNAEQILYWLSKGAKASPRVHNLMIAKGIIQGKKINVFKTTVTTGIAAGAVPSKTPIAAGAETVDAAVTP